MAEKKEIIKLFNCDLNWVHFEKPNRIMRPSMPQDWAYIDPKEYFDWHIDFGNNIMYCQAYTFGGYAFYPTKLGPVAPGPGQELLPNLLELSNNAKIPFCAYFCVGADLVVSNMREQWVIPNSRSAAFPYGFLAPESSWTDLLCERIEEFSSRYKVDWILFDWFNYGSLEKNIFPLQPAWFVKKSFKEIIGRTMPDDAFDITDAESLNYEREVLARQFYRIKNTLKKTSPETKIIFNVPYFTAYDPKWVDHPMLNESDGIFSECTNEDVLDWLINIKKQNQHLMTTITGLYFNKEISCNTNTWEKWYKLGCDFFGYAWGVPPDFRPHKFYDEKVKIIRKAFKEIK
jgi:hypothetical protein